MLRALAVLGLLAGLIGMHHLLVTEPAPMAAVGMATPAAMSGDHGNEQPPPNPHDEHGSAVAHLCLAVLTAAAELLLGWLLWPRPHPGVAAAVARVARARSAPRAPPCGAPARLALLCVSRT